MKPKLHFALAAFMFLPVSLLYSIAFCIGLMIAGVRDGYKAADEGDTDAPK